MSSSRTCSLHLCARPERHRRLVACIAPLAVIALGVAAILPTDAAVPRSHRSASARQPASPCSAARPSRTPVRPRSPATSARSRRPPRPALGTVTSSTASNHGGDAVTQQAQDRPHDRVRHGRRRDPPTSVRRSSSAARRSRRASTTSATFGITGTLTLDTQGDPNAVFIFKTASTLTTASNSTVDRPRRRHCVQRVLAGRQLGDARYRLAPHRQRARGDVDHRDDRRDIQGRLLAGDGAVTLDTNTITHPVCAAAATTTTAGGSDDDCGRRPRRRRWPRRRRTRRPRPAPLPVRLRRPGTAGAPGTPAPGTPGLRVRPARRVRPRPCRTRCSAGTGRGSMLREDEERRELRARRAVALTDQILATLHDGPGTTDEIARAGRERGLQVPRERPGRRAALGQPRARACAQPAVAGWRQSVRLRRVPAPRTARARLARSRGHRDPAHREVLWSPAVAIDSAA